MKQPPLPSLRDLTRDLRSLHEAFAHPIAGGEFVALFLVQGVYHQMPRRVPSPDEWAVAAVSIRDQFTPLAEYGREYIPGDGAPFDAVAAARRLLAAARDAAPSPALGSDLP